MRLASGRVGEGPFLFSFLLPVAIRLPLLRRARRARFDAAPPFAMPVALALAEATVLDLAVAKIVANPSGSGMSVVRTAAPF